MKYPFYFVSILILVFYTPNIAVGGGSYLAEYTPKFQEAPCPFDADDEILEQVRCGYLIVPENRSVPDGRQLRLVVAILKSLSPTPEPDPIVFLSGGPGEKSVEYVPPRTTSPFWTPLREERDLVFFDQRGTGFSEPEFCPQITEEAIRDYLIGLSNDERVERLRKLLGSCREVMESVGVDLSQYNSVASAFDLRDLRRALGYEEWNVFGVSYGTRLALEVMRVAPEGIRSVVLDAPMPPNVPLRAEFPFNQTNVIHRLLTRCAADSQCDATYPDVEQRLWQLVETLHEKPLLIRGAAAGLPDPIVMDSNLFLTILSMVMYNESLLPLVPLFIQEVERGNTAMIRALLQPIATLVQEQSRGFFMAVECYEVAPFNGPDELHRMRGSYPEVFNRVGYIGAATADLAACDAWHPFRAPPELGEAVHSDIPTLIFTGEFDPITPTNYGQSAAVGLSNSYVIDVPGAAHFASPWYDCTRGILGSFIDDPVSAPDLECIVTEMESVRFITDVRVTPGISRVGTLFGPGSSRQQLAGLGVPLLFLFSVLAWPAGALYRRVRHREQHVRTGFELQARWAAGIVFLLAAGFLAALAWVIAGMLAENPFLLLFGVPDSNALLFIVPWLLLIGCVLVIVYTVLIWKRSSWGLTGKIHYTLVALSCVVFTSLVFMWGLV